MRQTVYIRAYALVSACVLSLLAAATGWSQTLTWFNPPCTIELLNVSEDGRIVTIGVDDNANWVFWTPGLEPIPIGSFVPTAISPNGTVVGYRVSGSSYSAVRWTVSGGMQDLGVPSGYRNSVATSVSADGSVVVGYTFTPIGANARGFRWTADSGFQILATPQDFLAMTPLCVSQDGSTIAGYGAHDTFGRVSIVWQNNRVLIVHGVDEEDLFIYDVTTPTAISVDGTVVGVFTRYNSFLGIYLPGVFVWSPTRGTEEIYWGWNALTPNAVSADGAVIVASGGGGLGAFRWRRVDPGDYDFDDLNRTYARLLTGGASMYSPRALSSDGRYIVGYGVSPSRSSSLYLLDTAPRRAGDVNRDGCVDDADLLQVLFAFGNTGANLPEDLNGDGTVDDADLLQVLFNFGSGC
jgi:uncharacterized membrane protein